MKNIEEIEVECNEAAVLRVDGYKVECDVILCCIGLEGNVCRPNMRIEVEVDVDIVGMECRKVKSEG